MIKEIPFAPGYFVSDQGDVYSSHRRGVTKKLKPFQVQKRTLPKRFNVAHSTIWHARQAVTWTHIENINGH